MRPEDRRAGEDSAECDDAPLAAGTQTRSLSGVLEESRASDMTRAEAIIAAIKAALTRRPVEGDDLRTLTIEVHLRAGSGHPRSVVIRPEYETILDVTLFSNGSGPMPVAASRALSVGPPSAVST